MSVAVDIFYSAATLKCHAALTRHNTPLCHCVQSQVQPVVLPMDVKYHTGSLNNI